MKLIERADIFGATIGLRFQQKAQNQTLIGGLITLIIFATSIASIIWFGQDIVAKENPTSLYIEESTNMPDRIIISQETFPFAFGLQDPVTLEEFIDPSYFQAVAQWQKMKMIYNHTINQYEQVWDNVPLTLEACTPDHFQMKDTYEYFKNLPSLSGKLCINHELLKEKGPLYIQGDFTSETFADIQILIYQCSPADEEKTKIPCKSQAEIDKQLNSAYFSAYFTDNLVKLNNLENPFKSFARDWFTTTSNQMKKYNSLNFRTIQIQTDEGVITESLHIMTNYVIPSPPDQQITFRNQADLSSSFHQFVIRCQKSQFGRYTRVYKKIQHLTAEIGGLLKILVTIGGLIGYPIAKLNMKERLVNDIFTFQGQDDELDIVNIKQHEEKQSKKQKQSKSQSEQFNSKNNQNEDQSHVSEENEYQNNHTDRELQGRLTRKATTVSRREAINQKSSGIIQMLFSQFRRILKMSKIDYFLYIILPIGNIGKQKKILQKSFQKITRQLDSIYIMRKLLEIDKLKMILFDENQRKLFEFLPRPVIFANQEEIQQRSSINGSREEFLMKRRVFNQNYFDLRNEYQRINDGLKALNIIKEKQIFTSLDEKLIEILDPQILKLLKNERQNNRKKELIYSEFPDQISINDEKLSIEPQNIPYF